MGTEPSTNPELALEIFKDEAMILDDAVITMYENNQPIVASNTIE